MTRIASLSIVALLTAVGCRSWPATPGVLTLAPAGMRASAGCKVEEDQTSLSMPSGARVMAVAYAPEGALRVAIFGRSVASRAAELVVYFDGNLVQRAKLAPGTVLSGEDALVFTVEVPKAGVHSWEFEVQASETDPGGGPVFRFEKFAITVS